MHKTKYLRHVGILEGILDTMLI